MVNLFSNAKDRVDDIPNCPSLESVEYYEAFGTDEYVF